MTINEAADALGLAPSTLRVQIRNGKLRGTKRGRDWWLTPAELERYQREHLRALRCTARHPLQHAARCDDAPGHPGEHTSRYYLRHWEDDTE